MFHHLSNSRSGVTWLVSTSQPTAPARAASTYHHEASGGMLVATAPGPTADEPP